MNRLTMLVLAALTLHVCGAGAEEPSAPLLLKSAPILSFTPTTPTQWQVKRSDVATVTYEVKNNSKRALTFAMTPIQGVAQYSGNTGACRATFTLKPQESCLLTLRLTGSQLPARITGGPRVCTSAQQMQCNEPTQSDALNITRLDS